MPNQSELFVSRDKARAQSILDERGRPPYAPEAFGRMLTDDECAVLSEFVQIWLPYLKIEGKA